MRLTKKTVLLLLVPFVFASAAAQSAQDLLNLAEQLTARGKYDESNEQLSALYAAFPNRYYDLSIAYELESYNHLMQGGLYKAVAANEASRNIRFRIMPEMLGLNDLQDGRIALAEGRWQDALLAADRAWEYPYIDDPLIPAEISLLQAGAFRVGMQLKQAEAAILYAEGVMDIYGAIEEEGYRLQSAYWKEKAALAYENHNWGEAELAYRQVLAVSPAGDDAALLSLGKVLEEQGRYQGARSVWEPLLESDDQQIAFQAAIELAEGNPGQARRYLSRAQQVSELAFQQKSEQGKPGVSAQEKARYAKLMAEAILQESAPDWGQVYQYALQGLGWAEEAGHILPDTLGRALTEYALLACAETGGQEQAEAGWLLLQRLYPAAAAGFPESELENWQAQLGEEDALLAAYSSGRVQLAIALTRTEAFIYSTSLPQWEACLEGLYQASSPSEYMEMGQLLFEQWLAPSKSLWEGQRRLLVYAGGETAGIPFAGLPVGKEARGVFHRLPYLGRTTDVAYLRHLYQPRLPEQVFRLKADNGVALPPVQIGVAHLVGWDGALPGAGTYQELAHWAGQELRRKMKKKRTAQPSEWLGLKLFF